MQKNVLKHQFENFTTAPNESLDKAYDSQIALIMRNKPDIDQTDIDDLYNNLRVYEDEMKRSSSSTSNFKNLAFLYFEITSELMKLCWDEVVCSFFAQQTTNPPLDNEDSEIDVKKGHFAKECKSGWNQGKRSYGDNGRRNATTNEPSSKPLWTVDDEDDVSEVNTVSPVKTNETQTVKTQVDKIDYDFYTKKSPEPKLKTVVNTGQRVVKPVWDNAKRVNHQKISNKLKYPQARRTFVPSRVLTRTGLVNPVRPNGKRAVHTVSIVRLISTARPVSTARTFASKIAQTSSAIRPIYPRMDNVRPRASYSPIKRSYYTKPAFRPKNLKQDVKTSRVKNMTTARTKAVVNTGKGKIDNDLKKSRWGNLEICLQDHAVVDSGCSSHMTGNKAYLSDYEDYNGGFVAFGSDPKGGKITGKGKIRTANLDFDDVYFVDELKFNLFSVSQMCDKKNSVLFTDTECLILSPSFKLLDENQVVLRAPRQNGVYSLDLKNIVPSGGITCLYANATTDESKLWHRRLGHVNFKNINKLVKGHLVRGLPSKVFVNDHTCVACKKGKQHKASCKAKLERTIRKPLELLHMDLFGPVSVESINKKKYCLVVTDDFSRFSWVFFLATKDETNEILYKFITGLENQLNHKVKIIRSDHGIEFKNHAMNEFVLLRKDTTGVVC
ncbi:putative ribonuclease H-like domain-containing protein [Tanacetum coccineum]